MEQLNRIKYRVIVDDAPAFFADSLEEAETRATERSDGHLSMKVEALTGVGPDEAWHFDYSDMQWAPCDTSFKARSKEEAVANNPSALSRASRT